MALALLFPPSIGARLAQERAEALRTWLSKALEVEVEVGVAKSYGELRARVLSAEVDMAWSPPGVIASVEPFVEEIFKAIRGGHSNYRAALVARPGEIGTLDGVQGKRAAWVDRLSTAGHILPRAHLRAKGLDPDTVLATQQFFGSFDAALRAVANGEADIASVYVYDPDDDAVADRLRTLIGEDAQNLVPFDYTHEAPSDGLVITKRPAQTGASRALQRFRTLVGGPRQDNVMLTTLEADKLVPATPHEYANVFRQP